MSEKVKRLIARGSFCTLATASSDGIPHVVGILYRFVDGHLYFATGDRTKKVRNIQKNPRVAVCIPVRQYPVGPPFSVQLQGTAAVLARNDAEILTLLEAGKLNKITRFGVLKEPDLCFLKVKPSRKVHTFGIGVPLLTLLRAPARADRTWVFD